VSPLQPSQPSSKQPLPKATLLLVDDIAENLLALEALLRRPDLEVLKARSGDQALELLLIHDVALVLLDVQMPDMDGFELAELMRGSERTQKVPIIFVTAGARDQKRVFKGYEAGAVDFLFKPIESHVLRHKVDTFVQLHTQKLRLAEQLHELRKSAEERERLVRELSATLRLTEMFTAVLGHDLRNPLSVITTSAAMLLRRFDDEAVLKSVNRVLASGRRMARMIDDLLDLSRVRLAGGIPLSYRQLDLVDLCQRVVADHQVTNPGHRILLRSDGDGRGAWDEDRMFQVLSNLLGNALHHGSAGTPVSVRLRANDADEVVVEVRNAGTIAAELLPHLFDPFRSGHVHRERSQGLGLGLFIVGQIVAAHAGSVTVTSTDQEGTTFIVRLPRVAQFVGPTPDRTP
jgi:two-component system, sensor histidine kinase and response regulator